MRARVLRDELIRDGWAPLLRGLFQFDVSAAVFNLAAAPFAAPRTDNTIDSTGGR
jgi:hypothetical protein